MKISRVAAVCIFAATIMLAFIHPVSASDSDKLTIFTFSAPVELPGVTLPAGTYVFKIMDTMADRNLVQVWDKDRQHLYATFMTVPDYRLQPSDKTIVRFSETAQGGPPALKHWFYPSDQFGQEFVYPKSRAVELAKAAKQPVPSMPSNLASNVTKATNSSTDANVTAMRSAQLKAQQANGQEAELNQAFGSTTSAQH